MRFHIEYTASIAHSVDVAVDTLEELDAIVERMYVETTFSEYEIIDHDENVVGLDEKAARALSARNQPLIGYALEYTREQEREVEAMVRCVYGYYGPSVYDDGYVVGYSAPAIHLALLQQWIEQGKIKKFTCTSE